MDRLILYSTTACTLCDQALDLLFTTPGIAGLQLDVIDVATDETLMETYGERIPVLRLGEAELAAPFDAKLLADFLAR
jgi:hypothetical protein